MAKAHKSPARRKRLCKISDHALERARERCSWEDLERTNDANLADILDEAAAENIKGSEELWQANPRDGRPEPFRLVDVSSRLRMDQPLYALVFTDDGGYHVRTVVTEEMRERSIGTKWYDSRDKLEPTFYAAKTPRVVDLTPYMITLVDDASYRRTVLGADEMRAKVRELLEGGTPLRTILVWEQYTLNVKVRTVVEFDT